MRGTAFAVVLVCWCLLGASFSSGSAAAVLGRRSLLQADIYRQDGTPAGVRPNGVQDRSFTPTSSSGQQPLPGTADGYQPGPDSDVASPGSAIVPAGNGDDIPEAPEGSLEQGSPYRQQSDPITSQPAIQPAYQQAPYQQAAQPAAAGQQQIPGISSGNTNPWGVPTGSGMKQPRGGQGFGRGNIQGTGNNQGFGGAGIDSAGSNPIGWNGNGGRNNPAGGWNGNNRNGNPGQGVGAAGNWGGNGGNWGGNRGNGGGRWRNNKGDRQSLETLTGPGISSYPGIRPQPITVTGTAGTLSQGIRRRGNARAAAQSLAQAYNNGQTDAAAQAVASAATGTNAAESSAVAQAVAETTFNHPKIAPGLLAKSAGYAVNQGQTDRYADTMADAFVYARKTKHVPQFTTAVADAIATGGAPTRYAYGQAIATAIADGGEGQAAVAEATASAFCTGGSTASAWASAYAVALTEDSRGCLVLNQAKAMAKAQCGNGASDAFSKAEATSLVLGFCGLLDMIPGGVANMGWSGSNSGSNTASNNYGGLLQNDYNGK